MKDRDVETHLRQHLSGDSPREAFRQQVLGDSTAEFVRVCRRRSAWRRAALAVAAVLTIGVAFLGGRLSVPAAVPGTENIAQRQGAELDGVTVPDELVAWLDAARFFRHLGMQDRMARAVERAGRLLPADAFTADGRTMRVFAAAEYRENQTERVEPMGISGPKPSAESISQILAQSFGD